ncbi:unnamed protein product, partial [Mesorhabditis belari]|uniref:Mitochondrial processing peptidase beta subunit n=1 Tax=Mesorhabditis belari TaxID=2138241 RepID=A0AAF3J9X2_9BILA
MITRTNRQLFNNGKRWRTAAASMKNYFFPETIVTTLPNGFRVATEDIHIPTATIGVWIDAGSRYENETNNGTAHFLEHMAFKGTSRRSQVNLELEVENIGAHLNAYTSREQTVYYAKCFSKDLDNSVDILSDILLHSLLGKREIEIERGVILREQEEVEQNFQEVVFDHLHTAAFKDNPLSMTILGSTNNIKTITRQHLVDYIKTHYRSGRMVLAASGGVKHDQVVRLAEKYFGELPIGSAESAFIPAQFKPCELKFPVNEQEKCYGAISVEGTSWSHHDTLTLMVANTMLGEFDRYRGGAFSMSRLAARLAQNTGILSFQCFNTCYKDTGLTGIYFSAQKEAVSALVEAIIAEWKWLATAVDKASVERGKKTLLTNLLLMLDGTTPVTEDIGRQLLCYGRRIPVPELEYRINSISVENVRDVCARTFCNKKLATTYVGATDSVPDNSGIESMLKL